MELIKPFRVTVLPTGKEIQYRDEIYHNTVTVLDFWDRIRVLFGKPIRINSTIYTRDAVDVVGCFAKPTVDKIFKRKSKGGEKGCGEIIGAPGLKVRTQFVISQISKENRSRLENFPIGNVKMLLFDGNELLDGMDWDMGGAYIPIGDNSVIIPVPPYSWVAYNEEGKPFEVLDDPLVASDFERVGGGETGRRCFWKLKTK